MVILYRDLVNHACLAMPSVLTLSSTVLQTDGIDEFNCYLAWLQTVASRLFRPFHGSCLEEYQNWEYYGSHLVYFSMRLRFRVF